MAAGQGKIREHKLIDKHPILGSLLVALVFYVITTIAAGVINLLIGSVIPGYPRETGPVGTIAGLLLVNLLFCLWFKPETEGMLKGGEPKAAVRYILVFAGYTVLTMIASIVMEGIPSFSVPNATALSTALTAGCIEELVFRGLIITPMMRRGVDRKRIMTALVISSVIFGLAHGANALGGADPGSSIIQIFTSMCIGFVLGAMYLRSGNLWPGIITHFLFDVVAIAMSSGVSDNGIITEGISAGSWVNLAFCIAAAIIAVILFRKEEEISGTIRVWKGKWKAEA